MKAMRNKLIMKYPSSSYGEMWREAMPVGNGEIGGLVYGGVYHEIITVNCGKLWWQYRTEPLPDMREYLEPMRQKLMQYDISGAERIMSDHLIESGYNPTTGIPLSVCDLNVVMNSSNPFKKYRRVLDMENGVAHVQWQDGNSSRRRSFFISRADDTAYYQIATDDEDCYEAELYLSLHDMQTIGDTQPPVNVQTKVDGNYLYFAATKDDGTDFGAVCYVNSDGTMQCSDEKIHITASRNTEVYLRIFYNEPREAAWKRLGAELGEKMSFASALERHAKLHAEIFNAFRFDIGGTRYDLSNEELLMEAYDGEAPAELIEKMWSFGRYLLIAASRSSGYPCQLYGLWCGSYRPMWPWNMLNVNLQMIYWQTFTCNMPQIHLSVFDYIESKMDDFRENARKFYNCRGINISAVSTPESGLHKMIHHPHILHWTGAAGWLAQHYFNYYLYTGDVEFLKNRAMPFMYETALFYEDFMLEDENGMLLSIPSNSPENVPGNVEHELGSTSEIVANATMDFAILKELLNNLLKGCELTGLYADKCEHWRCMLDKIPPYTINADGAVREWNHPFYTDNYEHRHLSHIYPIFPGTEITRTNNPKLFKAFERAVEMRRTIGLKDQSGWSLMYMANIFGRIGDGDSALECLDMLLRSTVLNNFFTVHNDWRRMGIAVCIETEAPVQLDANMGFTAAAAEMLLYSTEEEIFVFNALPKRWEKGTVGPLLTKTRTQVMLEWNKNTASVRLTQKDSIGKFQVTLPENMLFENDSNSIEVTIEPQAEVTLHVKILG